MLTIVKPCLLASIFFFSKIMLAKGSGLCFNRGMANNLPTEKKALAISLLCEGSSIRAIERITGVHRDTIMRLGVRVGEACAKIQDAKMQRLACRRLEIDEIWGF